MRRGEGVNKKHWKKEKKGPSRHTYSVCHRCGWIKVWICYVKLSPESWVCIRKKHFVLMKPELLFDSGSDDHGRGTSMPTGDRAGTSAWFYAGQCSGWTFIREGHSSDDNSTHAPVRHCNEGNFVSMDWPEFPLAGNYRTLTGKICWRPANLNLSGSKCPVKIISP